MSRTDLHDQNLLKVILKKKEERRNYSSLLQQPKYIDWVRPALWIKREGRKDTSLDRWYHTGPPRTHRAGRLHTKRPPPPPCTTPHDHPTHWETPAISPTWDDHKIGQNSKHTNQWFTTEQLVACRLSNTITQRQHANFLTSPILIKMGLGLRRGLPEPQIWDRPQAPPPVGTAENRQHQEVDFLGCWVTQRPRMRALTTKDPTQVSTASHNA